MNKIITIVYLLFTCVSCVTVSEHAFIIEGNVSQSFNSCIVKVKNTTERVVLEELVLNSFSIVVPVGSDGAVGYKITAICNINGISKNVYNKKITEGNSGASIYIHLN
ncbi:hypothetical protein [Kangiella sediminilitoris]|uniref:Uncharacterized protein n=1 Tax=Kangiella sediminilitoris TaxID=1144748 RepID=A0A1B3BA10_9GAMM|nr:hypothetical protein [Kangiella sediminilitoris]AOE49633.1 hypothetical protein KS2013_911 [Kangiella sediminilitoris]